MVVHRLRDEPVYQPCIREEGCSEAGLYNEASAWKEEGG
jgi:hypothetical protein